MVKCWRWWVLKYFNFFFLYLKVTLWYCRGKVHEIQTSRNLSSFLLLSLFSLSNKIIIPTIILAEREEFKKIICEWLHNCRNEEKLEPRFNFEGHQLGVVSVDINLTGTSILQTQCILIDANSDANLLNRTSLKKEFPWDSQAAKQAIILVLSIFLSICPTFKTVSFLSW